MATIYAGDASKIDRELLEALKRLPDDFWVFAEFDIGRNVDLFIVREVTETAPPGKFSTAILTEVKRVPNVIRGINENAVWEVQQRPGEWRSIIPSNSDDVNYFRQAINSTNALKSWLWNNQRHYSNARELQPENSFRVWPDLLLLSDSGLYHQLPVRPANGFGAWWHNMEDWLDHVQLWEPKMGMRLGREELERLAVSLGVRLIWESPQEQPRIKMEMASIAQEPPDAFATWLYRLADRVQRLEEIVEGLQRAASATAAVTAPGAAARVQLQSTGNAFSRSLVPPSPVARSLNDDEREALVAAIRDIREWGQNRAVPNVLEKMKRHLSYSLSETGYNGFLSATAFFDQAVTDGIVRYGPRSGPNPTIFLTDE